MARRARRVNRQMRQNATRIINNLRLNILLAMGVGVYRIDTGLTTSATTIGRPRANIRLKTRKNFPVANAQARKTASIVRNQNWKLGQRDIGIYNDVHYEPFARWSTGNVISAIMRAIQITIAKA